MECRLQVIEPGMKSQRFSVIIPTVLLVLLACGGPGGAESHNSDGVKYFEEGRFEDAIAEYDEALRLDSQYAVAYYNRGAAYFTLGQFERAIEDYGEAIRLTPNDPGAALSHAGRAMAYTALGQDADAQPDIAKAVELGYNLGSLMGAIELLKEQR